MYILLLTFLLVVIIIIRRLKHQNYLMQLNKEYNLTNFEISTIEAQLNITRRQHMEISEFLEKDSIEFKENYETLLMFYK